MKAITLLLVAGEPGLLQGLRMRLSVESHLVVVAEATTPAEAARLAQASAPDVVVVDIDAPTGTRAPLEVAVALSASYPVVVLSLRDDHEAGAPTGEPGAIAFVRKHDNVQALIRAIDAAAREGRGEDT